MPPPQNPPAPPPPSFTVTGPLGTYGAGGLLGTGNAYSSAPGGNWGWAGASGNNWGSSPSNNSNNNGWAAPGNYPYSFGWVPAGSSFTGFLGPRNPAYDPSNPNYAAAAGLNAANNAAYQTPASSMPGFAYGNTYSAIGAGSTSNTGAGPFDIWGTGQRPMPGMILENGVEAGGWGGGGDWGSGGGWSDAPLHGMPNGWMNGMGPLASLFHSLFLAPRQNVLNPWMYF